MRITGTVLKVEFRSGTARQSGNPYAFHSVRVLTDDRDVFDVTISSSPQPVPTPAVDDRVDYIVAVPQQTPIRVQGIARAAEASLSL